MNNLNGSEKQIAWATDIRKEFIEKTKADMKSADKNDVLDIFQSTLPLRGATAEMRHF